MSTNKPWLCMAITCIPMYPSRLEPGLDSCSSGRAPLHGNESMGKDPTATESARIGGRPPATHGTHNPHTSRHRHPRQHSPRPRQTFIATGVLGRSAPGTTKVLAVGIVPDAAAASSKGAAASSKGAAASSIFRGGKERCCRRDLQACLSDFFIRLVAGARLFCDERVCVCVHESDWSSTGMLFFRATGQTRSDCR